ncbi:MAG: 50S ribosomal protein L11 methyltransferase [Burkholderiaceae bacterium]
MSSVQSLRFECAPQGDPLAQADWIDGLTDSLLDFGALTVSVEDPFADRPDEERPLFGEPGMPQDMQAWPLCRVTLLLDGALDAQLWWSQWLDQIPEAYSECRSSAMEAQRVEDCDWVSQTQRQFEPILLERPGCRPIWVGPHWHEPPERLSQTDAVVLRIDPGMAFGTGGHATTQLCLQAIQAIDASGPLGAVLDYGCGSGVLGIAAARLSATSVTAIDIDPIAVEVARTNAQRNQIGIEMQCGLPDRISGATETTYDLVVANILAQPLKLLAPLLWGLVKPGGGLILSGLLVRQQDELTEAYAQAAPDRPRLTALASQEGWLCLGVWPSRMHP